MNLLRQVLWVAAPLSVLAASPGLVSAATTILPGFWESKNHSELLTTKDSVDRKCITPAQVESYLSGPANSHYTCVYDHREVGDGVVKLAGQCVDKSGIKVDVVIAGTYTPESFHLKGQLRTKFATLPIGGMASIDARRLSAECPPPQPKPAMIGN